MSKAIVRFLAILGALWLIGMFIILAAVIGACSPKPPSVPVQPFTTTEGICPEEPRAPGA